MTQKDPSNAENALVKYRFTGKGHTIVRPPHKSSKSGTPYKRTYPRTMQRIKEVARESKPSAAFEKVETEMGGGASNSGKLPRSISDFRKRLFGAAQGDELAILIGRCKCLEEEVPFVRSVQAVPQPLCVLQLTQS